MHKCSFYIRQTINLVVGRYALVLNPVLEDIISQIFLNNRVGINFISWNYHGAQTPNFRRNFRQLLDYNKPSLVVLFKTHREDHTYIPQEFQFSNIIIVLGMGHVGGITILWLAELLNVTTLSITP